MYIKTFKNELKSKHPDCLLLFRVNDDYCLVEEDAQVAQEVLGFDPKTLGKEQMQVASFPTRDLDTHLPKFIRAGHRVAICDLPFTPTYDHGSEMYDWKGAATLKRYRELYNQHPDTEKYGVFYAFGKQQLADGVRSLINRGYIAEGEESRIRSYGCGLHGIPSEVERFLDFYKERNRRIAEECDPYEVYCYEYNNHESGISCDGDLGAISLIVDYWGEDVARTIRRRSAFYSIESIAK